MRITDLPRCFQPALQFLKNTFSKFLGKIKFNTTATTSLTTRSIHVQNSNAFIQKKTFFIPGKTDSFYLAPIAGDGSCLFGSIQKALAEKYPSKKIHNSHLTLRNEVARHFSERMQDKDASLLFALRHELANIASDHCYEFANDAPPNAVLAKLEEIGNFNPDNKMSRQEFYTIMSTTLLNEEVITDDILSDLANSFLGYLQDSKQFAGGVSLFLLSDLLNIKINVFTPSKNPTNFTVRSQGSYGDAYSDQINLLLIEGAHYEPLIENSAERHFSSTEQQQIKEDALLAKALDQELNGYPELKISNIFYQELGSILREITRGNNP